MDAVMDILRNIEANVKQLKPDNASLNSLGLKTPTTLTTPIGNLVANSKAINNTARTALLTSVINEIFLPTVVFGIIVIIIGCISNTLIIKSCLTIRKSNSHKATLFITSLAVNDLLCLVLMVGYIVYMLVPSVQSRIVNNILTSSHVFLSCNSQFHNAVISVERAVALSFPVRHRVLLTNGRAVNSIFLLWISSCTLFIIALIRQNNDSPIYDQFVFWLCVVAAFPLPVTIVLISYTCIAMISCKRARTVLTPRENLCHRRRNLSNELRILFNISVMVLPMTICWSVFFVGTIYEAVTETLMSLWVDWTLTFLPFFASAINPILYMIGTRSLQTRVKKSISMHRLQRVLNKSNEVYI